MKKPAKSDQLASAELVKLVDHLCQLFPFYKHLPAGKMIWQFDQLSLCFGNW